MLLLIVKVCTLVLSLWFKYCFARYGFQIIPEIDKHSLKEYTFIRLCRLFVICMDYVFQRCQFVSLWNFFKVDFFTPAISLKIPWVESQVLCKQGWKDIAQKGLGPEICVKYIFSFTQKMCNQRNLRQTNMNSESDSTHHGYIFHFKLTLN